ncbi:unnamed protein product [Adineta steineri]|uniref:TRPM SLOG domain-containing protein n=1 Tax=Adineta steineri TaxID=433720 RepID=A0A815CNN9_9BILA|nr:unnamed protein product [Adineta steineri]
MRLILDVTKRKVTYVRFPFFLPPKDKKSDKSNAPQQTSLQCGQSNRKQSKNDSYEEHLATEGQKNVKERSLLLKSDHNDDGTTDPQSTQTNKTSAAHQGCNLPKREKLLSTNNNEDDVAEKNTIVFEAAEIVDFMRTAWNLPSPELIISVTGGAKLFEIISPNEHQQFQQDLVQAATATNAWVFTGGTHTGVMKEVGDAYDKFRYKNTKKASQIPYIGIASWYATTDYKQLKQNPPLEDKNKSTQVAIDQTRFNKKIKKKAEDRVRLYRTRKPSDKEKPETKTSERFKSELAKAIIVERNREDFIKMMESPEGYFLLNSFKVLGGDKKPKLDDAIMQAQLNDRDLDDALVNALRRYSVNFVDIFIERNASFERLQRLFNITSFYIDLYHKERQEQLHLPDDLYNKISSSVSSNSGPQTEQHKHTQKNDDIIGKEMKKTYYKTYLGKKYVPYKPKPQEIDYDLTLDDAYGFLNHKHKKDFGFNGMLTFSCNDAIRHNGHVTSISINFCDLLNMPLDNPSSKDRPSILLYIISPTRDENEFVITHQYSLPNEMITELLSSERKSPFSDEDLSSIRTVQIQESTLYLEVGQFLAIGFDEYFRRPFHVKGSDSYYIAINTVNKLKTGEAQLFIRQSIYCAAFRFTIKPAIRNNVLLGFIPDLLLWSLFSDRPSLATCLCSHSENTIVATLLANKIYRFAAELVTEGDKIEEYLQEAKYDLLLLLV